MLTLLDALADPSRREILGELMHGQKKVGEIVQETGLKQPNVSNHLAKMRIAGIVRSSKIGREVYYAINDPDLVRATRGIVLGQDDHTFIALDSATALDFARTAASGEINKCENIITLLLKQGEPLASIYSKLFDASMQFVGDWWQVKAINEAQEHLATSIVEQGMARVSQFYECTHKIEKKAVLGCSEGNLHSIGLKMIHDVMRSRGWHCLLLGANVPNEPFLQVVKTHRPDVVLVSCCYNTNIDRCCQLVEALDCMRNDEYRFQLCVGGAAVIGRDELKDKGVDHTANNLNEFTEITLPKLENSLVSKN